jgi:hypothetical protein
MALGDTYATETELRTYGTLQAAPQGRLLDALKTASRGIEGVCHRQFNKADSATPRVYRPGSSIIETDDFYESVGLVVETRSYYDTGYSTPLVLDTDFELHPLNGVVNGQTGWPFNEIWTSNTHVWSRVSGWSSVRVTAKWGWNAVPEPVKAACLIIALETYKLGDAAFGVAGIGSDNLVLRVKSNPMAMEKLADYVVDPVQVA